MKYGWKLKLNWTVRCQVCLINIYAYLILPDRWGSTTQAKFLDLFGYCSVINCTFDFHTTNVFGHFHLNTSSISSQISLHCTFICAAFKSNMWSNAQHVRALTTTILPTAAGNFHKLICFSHVTYAQETSTYYQNIAKLLTHQVNCLLLMTHWNLKFL